MKRWTDAQKEWMSHIRREGHRKKSEVSLSKPPWKDREISVAPLPEAHADLKEENKRMKD
tara:strand:+ start:203 stop:382 length:180 start_codon:yes stop_codon:yes gene_type:complete